MGKLHYECMEILFETCHHKWNEATWGSVIKWQRVGKYQPYPVRTLAAIMVLLLGNFSNKKVENGPGPSKGSRFENSAVLSEEVLFWFLWGNVWWKWYLRDKLSPQLSQTSSYFSKDVLFSTFFGRKQYLFAKRYQNRPSCGHGNGSTGEPFWLNLFFSVWEFNIDFQN